MKQAPTASSPFSCTKAPDEPLTPPMNSLPNVALVESVTMLRSPPDDPTFMLLLPSEVKPSMLSTPPRLPPFTVTAPMALVLEAGRFTVPP